MVNYIEATLAPLKNDGQIKLHGPAAFAGMRKAGRLVAECLDAIDDIVAPRRADRRSSTISSTNSPWPTTRCRRRSATRATSSRSCISINHVVCHGIPSDKPLRDGDIVNIDVTLIVDGWHGDSSRMYKVGDVKRAAERLVEVTYEAMMRGIEAIRPGRTTGDIGDAIQDYAERERCSVVRDFCGHGVGQLLPRRAQHPSLRQPRRRRRPEAGHDLHRRADDQSRPPAREDARRRLDGGDPRPLALGAVRALGRRHRNRLRDLHAVAEGPRLRHAAEHDGLPRQRPGQSPTTTATASGFANASTRSAARTSADYELLELILFQAIPRRDTKPIAKALLQKFGSFGEVLAAPEARLTEVDGVGERRRHHLKVV